MKMEMGLAQRQTMKITMTQELQQAIAVLQYSSHELTTFLEWKAMENPLVQLEPSMINPNNTHYESVKRRNTNNMESYKDKWLEQIADSDNLATYLFSQLGLEALSKEERSLAERLIYNLDANGYLTISLEDIAVNSNIDLGVAENCLKSIQGLDPPGIAARTLQECLLLQARRKKDIPNLVIVLLEYYFNEFADKKWKSISDKLSVSLAEIQKAADLIKRFNPRPGAQFNSEHPEYVIPDLILHMKEGHMELQLCEKYIPTISFQNDYYSQMKSYKDQQVDQFLNEKRQDFKWIMDSLEQRRITLIKIGIAITEIQRDFFVKGPRYLRPLTMKELADRVDVHESTVSRAVRGKYIQTPNGMFELKMFFSQALQTDDQNGEHASAGQAKMMIEEMVQEENKGRPLSDQKIVEQLKVKGMSLSRRTVAKYRDQLGIPSSTKRKVYV